MDENFEMSWKTDQIEKLLTVKLEVKTKGWIAFGFSSNGLFSEADLMVAWVTNARISFSVSFICCALS